MKDFLDQLDSQLQAMATLEAEHAPASPAPRKTHRRRRPAVLAGVTATLATLATVFAMSGTSMADLPILNTPTTDATALRDAAPGARKAGVDFSKAHTFPTPQGRGYVFLTPARDVLCLSVPQGAEHGGACAPPARVEREGLSYELVGDLNDDPNASSMVVFILPEGASQVRLAGEDGPARAADVNSGVVAISIRARTRLLWQRAGRTESRAFEGPFPAGGTLGFTCPDGRKVSTPLEGATLPGRAGRIRPEIRERLCG